MPIAEGLVSKVNHRGDREPSRSRGVSGREPSAVQGPTPWQDLAPAVARNGFSPVVVLPGTKRPRFREWDKACGGKPNIRFITNHARSEPTDSVGIACGVLRDPAGKSLERLWGYDIDTDDPAEADRHESLAVRLLGPTPFVRTRPNSPRRVLLYRTEGRVKPEKLDGAEILAGGMFVAFGRHPTGVDYVWRDASPADTPATAVPLVASNALEAFRKAAGGKMAKPRPFPRLDSRKGLSASPGVLATIAAGRAGSLHWTNEDGLVIDGRENFLTWCIGKAAGDARRGWMIFERHVDLSRPKGSASSCWWTLDDAEAKAEGWRRKNVRRKAGTRAAGRPRAGHRALLNADQRRAHDAAVDRAYRQGRIGSASVEVSAAMLDFATGLRGMCTASLETIGRAINRGRSTVAKARQELTSAGLWSHQDAGVYAPVLSGEFFGTQPVEHTTESTETVQPSVGPKSPVGVSPPRPDTPATVSGRGGHERGDARATSGAAIPRACWNDLATSLARMRIQPAPGLSIPWNVGLRLRPPIRLPMRI